MGPVDPGEARVTSRAPQPGWSPSFRTDSPSPVCEWAGRTAICAAHWMLGAHTKAALRAFRFSSAK